MNTRLLVLMTLLIPFCLSSSETPQDGYVSSKNASYDGNALKLSGHVVLEHGLGKMTSQEAVLEKQDSTKEFPFSLIHLRNEVMLSLKNNAKLHCDFADLDFTALKGLLSSPASGRVSFTDVLSKNEGKEVFVELNSPNVELSFIKQGEEEKKIEYEVDTIAAKNSVNVNYNKEFFLNADHALYRKITSSTAKEFQGIISAYAKDESSYCLLNHEKDQVEASSIDLDLLHSMLTMHNPKGFLASSLLPQHQKGSVSFYSDILTWDNTKNLLTLKGNSKVIESALGTITSEKFLSIQQTEIKGMKVVSKIETKGPTQLVYKDPSSEALHKLSCNGTMKMDRSQLQAKLTSPSSKASKDKFIDRIKYEEPKMGAMADSALVEFSPDGDQLHPISLTLKGNVCLFSRDEQEPFRCGIADRMTYSPDTKTVILSANPGQKVLFWDELQAVRMSAQEVHLTQNPSSHQVVIQGVGNVRFSLSIDENEVLKKTFPQYKPAP